MRRMLNTVDNDEALRRPGPDGSGDAGNIHIHAGERTGVNDGGHARAWFKLHEIVVNANRAGGIVMHDEPMMSAGMPGPEGGRRTRRGVLERRAEQLAARAGGQSRHSEHAEQQLGPRLADNHFAAGSTKEGTHVGPAPQQNFVQPLRARIIAPQVIGDGGQPGTGLHHGVQGERAAGVFQKDPLALKRAAFDMSKTAAYRGKQISIKHGQLPFLVGWFS